MTAGPQPQPEPALRPFAAQPYPLFLADWNNGQPLVGRIIGWVDTGWVPEPVVVFEQDGQSWMPIRVNMATSHVKSGPVWIRESADRAREQAHAYTPGATPNTTEGEPA